VNVTDLNSILDKHGKWLYGGLGGEQANLSWAELSGADLSGANLSGADLLGADLSGANLSGADLLWTNLSRANLSGADLSGADLSRADLLGANLSGADLSWTNLSRANLSGAVHDSSFAHGKLLAFDWTMYIHQGGARWLRYGCEHHPIAWWVKNATKAAKQHRKDNGDAAVYAKATRALAAFVKALPGKPKQAHDGKRGT
jgi:uncharacterized protein YjbI with pentapeptide repeats